MRVFFDIVLSEYLIFLCTALEQRPEAFIVLTL